MYIVCTGWEWNEWKDVQKVKHLACDWSELTQHCRAMCYRNGKIASVCKSHYKWRQTRYEGQIIT